MRRRIRTFLAVLLVISSAFALLLHIALGQSISAVVPGVSLADIRLGASIANVTQRLGAPSEVRLAGPDGTLAYVFGRYGIVAYTRGGVIVALASTNSLLTTVRGVGLGSPVDAVIGTLGTPRRGGLVEGFPAITYETLGVAFGIDRQAVAAVMVFGASRAAPAAPAPAAPGAAVAPAPAMSPVVPSTPPVPAVTTDAAPPPSSSAGSTAAAPPSAATQSGAAPGVADVALTTVLPAATRNVSTGIPDVTTLRAYSIETLYLSQAGYLRYLVFEMTQAWLDPRESVRIVRDALLAPAH